MALKRTKRPREGAAAPSAHPAVRLEAGESFRRSFPEDRELLLVREGRELRSVIRHIGDETKEIEPDIMILEPDQTVFVLPVLPDRPLVLRPESELRILPNSSMSTVIPVPYGLGVATVPNDPRTLVREYPAIPLSKTWFGDPYSGEAAYAWETTLVAEDTPSIPPDWFAACPLEIRNESPEILGFKRMILRVPNLSLFTVGSTLATNGVTVRFRGEAQVSQVSISKEPTGLEGEIALIGGPRRPPEPALLRRSFHFIRSIYIG